MQRYAGGGLGQSDGRARSLDNLDSLHNLYEELKLRASAKKTRSDPKDQEAYEYLLM